MSPRVLCLGEMLLDRIADQVGPEPTSWTEYPGGAPANVACNLVKLGMSAGFIGCLGADQRGDRLLKTLQGLGVDTTGVQRHESAPTRAVEVLRDSSGDRSFGSFGDLGPSFFADAYLQADDLPVALFETAECLVLGTIPLAYPDSAQAVDRALTLVDKHYLKVVLDVNWRPDFWPNPEEAKDRILALLPRVDFIKLSEEEALWLFESKDPHVILTSLEEIEGVFITQGKDGCDYAMGDLVGRIPAFRVAVKDTTGAGDSFVAAFVYQLCSESLTRLDRPDQVAHMLRYANGAGAMTCMESGAIAAQPSSAELEAFLIGRVS
jgi:fructokinase